MRPAFQYETNIERRTTLGAKLDIDHNRGINEKASVGILLAGANYP